MAPSTPAARARAELTAAVVLDVVGAALALVSAGRPFVEGVLVQADPLADLDVAASGSTIAPAVPALGLVALAGVVALAATRRTGRVLVGGVLLLTGGALAATAVRAAASARDRLLDAPVVDDAAAATGLLEADATLWPVVTVVGGVLVALAGLLTAVRGRRWAALSGRFERSPDRGAAAPGARPAAGSGSGAVSSASAWDSLDRGEDPTADPQPGGPGAQPG